MTDEPKFADEEKIPSIGISLSIDIPGPADFGKRALVLQTFVSRDCETKDFDAVLDKIRIAGERQMAFSLLEAARRQLEVLEKQAQDHSDRIAQVEENMARAWAEGKKRGDPRVTPKEAQEKRQAYAIAETLRRDMEKTRLYIAECENRIARGEPGPMPLAFGNGVRGGQQV
jgi:hypothetical protein